MLSQFRSLNSDEAFFESANSRVHFGALSAHDYCNFCRLQNGCNCKKKSAIFAANSVEPSSDGPWFHEFFHTSFSCLQAAMVR